jgi:hypothetical protein
VSIRLRDDGVAKRGVIPRPQLDSLHLPHRTTILRQLRVGGD